MSVILITKHDENIYNITKSQADIKKKQLPFISKLKEKRKLMHPKRHLVCNRHATMGVAEEIPPDPAQYLKKHAGKLSYTVYKPPKEPKACENIPHKGKTPYLEELVQEKKEQKSSKNFIASNIKKMSKMPTKEPVHKVVVDEKGTTVLLQSPMEPVYVKLNKFGKTPKYLERFLEEKEREYQIKKDASGLSAQPICKYITRDEREQLLNGLKQNWEELQKQYQGLPILTDTIPKKIRKSKIESALKQLEKDIVLIERHPYIYVYNDDDNFLNK